MMAKPWWLPVLQLPVFWLFLLFRMPGNLTEANPVRVKSFIQHGPICFCHTQPLCWTLLERKVHRRILVCLWHNYNTNVIFSKISNLPLLGKCETLKTQSKRQKDERRHHPAMPPCHKELERISSPTVLGFQDQLLNKRVAEEEALRLAGSLIRVDEGLTPSPPPFLPS